MRSRLQHEMYTEQVKVSEVLSALSFVLDVVEGQPEGHVVRSCYIGMSIGECLGLTEEQRSALFYALLLKDSGCSSNASRMSALFDADDFEAKRAVIDRRLDQPAACGPLRRPHRKPGRELVGKGQASLQFRPSGARRCRGG